MDAKSDFPMLGAFGTSFCANLTLQSGAGTLGGVRLPLSAVVALLLLGLSTLAAWLETGFFDGH
jgi:hypothetical protein